MIKVRGTDLAIGRGIAMRVLVTVDKGDKLPV
jgi:Fe2+ transport system protein FeoA